MSVISGRGRRIAARFAAGVIAIAVLACASPAQAKEGETEGGGAGAAGGDVAVTVGGTTYNPATGRSLKLKNLAVSGPVQVSGTHLRFTIRPSTLGVYDYTLTGAPAPDRMVTKPTVLFASKVPVLTAAQLARPVLSQLEIRDSSVIATFSVAGGKLKIQAKDAPQGGIFQMEPEMGANVEIVHTLGAGIFYFLNEFTGKVNFGDGIAAVTPAQSASGYHEMLLGKDSPQVATKLEQTASTTRWSVVSGGRMGGVLGEDAIELSQGATNCIQDCQARNRIRGSLPVPPDPVDPTPLPPTPQP